ncbi:PqqD family protein [Murimonas intestini]|uniref:PqqD family protein n=1 Tax=Murimonas intestini TaxID=1337051 RepID=UPI0011DCD95F|nr:PqqD family protein [Murimonas intestini]
MKKEENNYLDYIPVPDPGFEWDLDEKGIVTVHMVNRGFYNWIAQKLFKRPGISHIRLDETGSFAWKQMDGKRSIYEIALLMEKHLSGAEGPGYSRLAEYFRILYRNHFIGYVRASDHQHLG